MPTAAPTHEFLWFDLETTGLDPHKGRVLEFACALCEDARGDDFAIVQEYTAAIRCEAPGEVDPAVLRMHTRNGLWAACEASTTTLAEVDAFLAALCASLTTRKHAITLAGNSVHFDLAWARVHLPAFAECLSHRVFDVSTLQRCCDSWAPAAVAWPRAEAHRALDDVHESIARARLARKAMWP